jgi:DNA excision repair protein ERCC-2
MMIDHDETDHPGAAGFRPAVPPCGSIESCSGSGRAAAEGREIHSRVQKRRKGDPSCQAEVPVSCFLQLLSYGYFHWREHGRRHLSQP